MTEPNRQTIHRIADPYFAIRNALLGHETRHETPLSLIKQRSLNDCGICCAAMLLDQPYEEAYDLCLPFTNRPRDDIDFDMLPAVFARAGKSVKVSTHVPNEHSHDGLCEISYLRNGIQQWHYIVWSSQQNAFLDPSHHPAKTFSIQRFLELDPETPDAKTTH